MRGIWLHDNSKCMSLLLLLLAYGLFNAIYLNTFKTDFNAVCTVVVVGRVSSWGQQ